MKNSEKTTQYITLTHKRLELGLCSVVFEFCLSVSCMLCNLRAAWADKMTENVKGVVKKLPFIQPGSETSLIQKWQNTTHLLIVILARLQNYNYLKQVYQDELPAHKGRHDIR